VNSGRGDSVIRERGEKNCHCEQLEKTFTTEGTETPLRRPTEIGRENRVQG
jgi:hypothetical protein